MVNQTSFDIEFPFFSPAMHRRLASLYHLIINNFPCSQEGIIILVKDMTSKEQRIEQIQNRITESKRALGVSRQAGPLMLLRPVSFYFWLPLRVLVLVFLVLESLRFCWRLSGHMPNQEMQLNSKKKFTTMNGIFTTLKKTLITGT